MTPADLNRALERLRAHAHEDAVTVWMQPDAYGAPLVVLTKPLAALIEAVEKVDGQEIYFDGARYLAVTPEYVESMQIALAALVRAINGDSRHE